jgi:hypothetical protein
MTGCSAISQNLSHRFLPGTFFSGWVPCRTELCPKKKEKREKKKYMVVKTKLREQTGEPGYNPKLAFKFRATLPWCRSPFASTLPILQINHHEVSEISY